MSNQIVNYNYFIVNYVYEDKTKYRIVPKNWVANKSEIFPFNSLTYYAPGEESVANISHAEIFMLAGEANKSQQAGRSYYAVIRQGFGKLI